MRLTSAARQRSCAFAGTCLAVIVLLAAPLAAARNDSPVDLDTPLPVDPAVRSGELANGMRYWLRPHPTPAEKVTLWLHVHSGSLNETDRQRGLAHFLEHLAFKGSEHFPAETMIKRFEALGMDFGRDQNAFTGFHETTYTLTLPNNRTETLGQALLAFADIAYRLHLDPAAIEPERSVILEEARLIKNPGERVFDRTVPYLVPDSRIARRMPIGNEDVIHHATRDDIYRYYKTWYRPDNTTLLVTGAIEPAVVERLVADHFAAWPAVDKPAPAANAGVTPYTTTRAAVVTDPEIADAQVWIMNLQPDVVVRSIGQYRDQLINRLANAIMNRRIDDLVRKGSAPFASATVDVFPLFSVIQDRDVSAKGDPSRWPSIIHTLVRELKRAREFGFLPEELVDVKRQFQMTAERNARTAATSDARVVIDAMNDAVRDGTPPMSSDQVLALYEALAPTITRADVTRAFRAHFAPSPRLYVTILPARPGLDLPVPKDILAVAAAAEASAVEAWAARPRPRALLDKDPESGTVGATNEDSELRVLSAKLDNGVRVRIRHMDDKRDHVTVRVTLAGGGLRETTGNHGITRVAALAFNQAATDTLSSSDIRDLLIGKDIQVRGRTGAGYLGLTVTSSPADLEDGLRLAHVLLTRAQIEETAFANWRQDALRALDRQRFNLDAQLYETVNQLYTGDDPRFRNLTRGQVERLTRADGQKWLEEMLRHAPIEVAIVGDVPTERGLALASRYLGSLPARPESDPDLARLKRVHYTPGPRDATIETPTHTPRGEAYVGWRGADWRNRRDRQVLDVAARILTRRLYYEIREQRGLVYAVDCTSTPANVYAGNGRFGVRFSSDPDKTRAVADLAQRIVEQFAQDGPNDEELAVVRKQIINELTARRKRPSFWASRLSRLDHIGMDLDELKTPEKRLIRYTRDDLVEVTRRYIKPEQRIRVIGTPASTQPSEGGDSTVAASEGPPAEPAPPTL